MSARSPIDPLLRTLTPTPDEAWWQHAEQLKAQGVDLSSERGKDNKTLAEALSNLITKEDECTQAQANTVIRLHQLGGSLPTPTVWRDLLLRVDAHTMKEHSAFFTTLLEDAALPAVAQGMRTLDGLFLMTAFACDRFDLVDRLVDQGVPYTVSAGIWPALTHGSQRAWAHMLERLDPRDLGQSMAGKLPLWHMAIQAQQGDISKAAHAWAQVHEPHALDALELQVLNKSIKAAMNQPQVIERLLLARKDWCQVRLPDKNQIPLWHIALAEVPEKVMAMLEQPGVRVDWGAVNATGDDAWAHWVQQADGSAKSLPGTAIKALAAHHQPFIQEGGWLERTITPTFLLSNRGVASLIKVVGNRAEVWWGATETHQNGMAERLPHLLSNLFNENVAKGRKSLLAIVEATDVAALTPSLRYAIVLHEQFRQGGPSTRVVQQCKRHGVEPSDKILESFIKFHTDHAKFFRVAHQEMALDKAWQPASGTAARKPRM